MINKTQSGNLAWNLKNDCDRLDSNVRLLDILPLGSGALAGNPFNINRFELAKSLHFSRITQNSMQAVSDRDFIADFLFWASMVGIHLSRLAEDLIIFSSKEFEFVTIDESYSTGSSLMPQKRNPDSLELIRGIGGSLFGQRHFEVDVCDKNEHFHTLSSNDNWSFAAQAAP
ncbi:hypothetical protein HUJ05_008505 [Dendroctonus ponderosae]|nr:hypothetical protein HUJ05_008505 [Dendroctonus ponderosae]